MHPIPSRLRLKSASITWTPFSCVSKRHCPHVSKIKHFVASLPDDGSPTASSSLVQVRAKQFCCRCDSWFWPSYHLAKSKLAPKRAQVDFWRSEIGHLYYKRHCDKHPTNQNQAVRHCDKQTTNQNPTVRNSIRVTLHTLTQTSRPAHASTTEICSKRSKRNRRGCTDN